MRELRTRGVAPRHWPRTDEAIADLVNTSFRVQLADALRAAAGSEDATLALRPQTRYLNPRREYVCTGTLQVSAG